MFIRQSFIKRYRYLLKQHILVYEFATYKINNSIHTLDRQKIFKHLTKIKFAIEDLTRENVTKILDDNLNQFLKLKVIPQIPEHKLNEVQRYRRFMNRKENFQISLVASFTLNINEEN